MDQCNRGAESGEEQRLLAGAIAAADDHNRLVAEEESVACGAVGDTAPGEGLLPGNLELAHCGSSGHHNGAGLEHITLIAGDGVNVIAEIDGYHVVPDQTGAKLFGLPLHGIHQIGAQNPVGESGEILHGGGIDQLPTGCEGTRYNQRTVPGAAQVDGRGVSGGAGTDNDNILNIAHASTISEHMG